LFFHVWMTFLRSSRQLRGTIMGEQRNQIPNSNRESPTGMAMTKPKQSKSQKESPLSLVIRASAEVQERIVDTLMSPPAPPTKGFLRAMASRKRLFGY
jgi:hypothetical protein